MAYGPMETRASKREGGVNMIFELWKCVLVSCAYVMLVQASAAESFRFDCGPEAGPVAEGYQRLKATDAYSAQRGYGWLTAAATAEVFKRPQPNRKLYGSHSQQKLDKVYDTLLNSLKFTKIRKAQIVKEKLCSCDIQNHNANKEKTEIQMCNDTKSLDGTQTRQNSEMSTNVFSFTF